MSMPKLHTEWSSPQVIFTLSVCGLLDDDARVCVMSNETVPPLEEFQSAYLREWRKHRGWTQDQLGELSGFGGSMISMLELGKRGYTLPTLQKLARALGTKVATLVSRPPKKDEPFITQDDEDAAPEHPLIAFLKSATPEQRAEITAHAEIVIGRKLH